MITTPVMKKMLEFVRKSNPMFRKYIRDNPPPKQEPEGGRPPKPPPGPPLQLPDELEANRKWRNKKPNRAWAKWIKLQFYTATQGVKGVPGIIDGLSMDDVNEYIKEQVFPKLKELKLLPSVVVDEAPRAAGKGLKFRGWSDKYIRVALYDVTAPKKQWEYVVNSGVIQHVLETLRGLDRDFIRYYTGEEAPMKEEEEDEDSAGRQQQIGDAIAAGLAMGGVLR